MSEALRILLDESILIIVAGAAFVWLVRRNPGKAVIAALLLLVIFDLGRYYLLTIKQATAPNKTNQSFRSSPNVFADQNTVLEGRIFSTYMTIFNKTPLLDMMGNNLIEFKDHFSYLKKSRQFLMDNRLSPDVQRRLRLVRKDKWEEFLTTRPQSLAMTYDPVSSAIKVRRFSSDELAIEVETSEPAYLYYQDNFDRGWEARVDGTAVSPIDTVPYKAVEIGAGSHTVGMSYRPAWRWALHFSLHLFVLGSGICLLLLYRGWISGLKRQKII